MRLSLFLIGCASFWACATSTSAQQSTETYTYDALGRLIEVQTVDAQNNTEQHQIDYDPAGNRERYVSSCPQGNCSAQPTLPPECALLGSTMPSTQDTMAAWPRVQVADACEENLQLSYVVNQTSGIGSWSEAGFGGHTGSDSWMNAKQPENDTTKWVPIYPVAGSVPTGTQLGLTIDWQVLNFQGSGTTATSNVFIDGTGSASCALNPVGFTTTQAGHAYPRVYTPNYAGCGYPVQMDFTISVVSGAINASDISAVFTAFDDTIGPTDSSKILVIYPVDSVTSETGTITLRVDWHVIAGNAAVNSPGYSLVTIEP